MYLRFQRPGQEVAERIELTRKPLTIGRSHEADLVIADERASRIHGGIEWIDDAFYLKDLKSKNGTFLNGERITSAPLRHGDRIRIGSMVLHVEEESGPGTHTAVHEVQQAMSDGKGYGTILREIVDSSEPPPRRRPG